MKKSKSKRKNHNTANNNLKVIADKRTGGAINIRGVGFQLLYACYRSLLELTDGSHTKIQLEGFEDVDVLNVLENEYVQLKTSINPIDASAFWKMGVLKNFMEVFRLNPNSKFLLVHNTQISKGYFDDLVKGKSEVNDFWKQKFLDSRIDLEGIDFDGFLLSITYKYYSENELIERVASQLIEKFQVNDGVLDQHLHTLFYNIHLWSRDRKTIDFSDIVKVFQELEDSFSKQVANPAIEYNWIRKILFEQSEINEDDSYFEGKAAKPHHIVNGLPVRRLIWEQRIEESIKSFNVTVIKSSSGQGKSTLAWCAAQNLKNQGYSIYELQNCEDQSQIAGLFDFLRSRLKIGETPLLVIDGLNSGLANWSKLIDQLQGIPVKIVVTTREEDWYRYGCDAFKVRLQVINIHLSITEAEEIFNQLKANNKLSDPLTRWQSAWELIEDKKLLIEYVFLLTRGQMIAERINHQIKELNNLRRGTAAKLEILRLISLADTLGIRISIESLSEFIQNTIRFEEDRGEVYKELESEYYFRFDEHYVEGLHPVRSQHLVSALHETIPLKGSVVSLFKIIEQTEVFDFFANLAIDGKIDQIQGLYEALAPILAEKSFTWKVNTLDGLLFYDIHNYWIINQQYFDEIFETGALDIFVMDMIPFQKLGVLEDLSKLSGNYGEGIKNLLQKKQNFSEFDIKKTEVWKFADSIKNQLPNTYESIQDYSSLGLLVRWFVTLDIPIERKLTFDENFFRSLMSRNQFLQPSELSKYFIALNDQNYISFSKKNKTELFSFLKYHTDSVILEEIDEDVLVKYILKDEEMLTSNESSVSRIDTIYGFLPFYKKYRAEASVLPFPNLETYNFLLQNAEKAMPAENIGDFFNIHLNQIWRKTILDKYRASSAFEWQEQILRKRTKKLEFVKMCTRYFESAMEDNYSRVKTIIKPLFDCSSSIIDQGKTEKTYPELKRASISKSLDVELKKINKWSFSMQNFIHQYIWLVKPENDNSRNVAYRNLESALYELPNMQQGFDNVLNLTTKYVENKLLNEEELEWYRRLFNVVKYYVEVFIPSEKTAIIRNAKNTLANWVIEKNEKSMERVLTILRSAESYLFFHEPKELIEKEKNLYAIVGVDYIDPNDDNDLYELWVTLKDLAETDIDYFYFVNVKNNRAIGAFQCHRNYFERIKEWIEIGGEFNAGVYGNPLPLQLTDVPLYVLDGVYFEPFENQIQSDAFTSIMYDVWRLQQYRTHLDSQSPFEQDLLRKKQVELSDYIKFNLKKLSPLMNKNRYDPIYVRTTEFLENRIEISTDDIVSELKIWTAELNDVLISDRD